MYSDHFLVVRRFSYFSIRYRSVFCKLSTIFFDHFTSINFVRSQFCPCNSTGLFRPVSCHPFKRLPVTWLNTIWLNFFVESLGLKILSQVTTKLGQLHSKSRNKYANSRKHHNVGHMRCMHARPHRRKDQLPLRSLRDLRSR